MFFCTGLLLFRLEGRAQNPVFYALNTASQLPTNEIYSLQQDDFGFVWMGTDKGLYRYDGFEFQKFTSPLQNSKSISFLHLDQQGNVWCKNFLGQVYCAKGDSINLVSEFATSDPSLPHFSPDQEGHVWILEENGFQLLTSEGKRMQEISLGEMKIAEEPVDFVCHRGKLYVVDAEMNVIGWEIESKTRREVLKPGPKTLPIRNIGFYLSGEVIFLLAEYDLPDQKYGIFQLENEVLDFVADLPNHLPGDRYYSIYADDHTVWGMGSAGVFQIDRRSKELRHPFFQEYKVSSMLRDREGMYWFSTLNNGLLVVPSLDLVKIEMPRTLRSEKQITWLRQAGEGTLLAGAYDGGIYQIDTGEHIQAIWDSRQETFLNVKTIYVEDRYTVVSRGRLCVIENKTGRQYFPRYSHVRDLVIVQDTAYLVFPEFIKKIAMPDLLADRFQQVRTVLPRGGTAIEYEPASGLLYFLLSDGLYILDAAGKWTQIAIGGTPLYASALESAGGTTWVGSLAKGVIGFQHGKIVGQYNRNKHLKENEVRGIEISPDFLWVLTENYLHRIDPKDQSVTVFGEEAGLPIMDINAMETFGKRLYLATHKGLIRIPENLNSANNCLPSIRLDCIELNGTMLPPQDRLLLKYGDASLRLHLSSIAFKNRGKYDYAYKIVPLDSAFTRVPAANKFVQIAHLPPGEFQFRVKAVTQQGLESQTLSLPIQISAPFWQEWWFFAGTILLLSTLVALVAMWRFRYLRRRIEYQNQLIHSQLTAIKSQMNPHFMFNTLNSLQDLMVKNDIRASNYYLTKFSSLLRKVLETSSQTEISLKSEIELLETYLLLEKLRFGDAFNFQILVEPELDPEEIYLHPMLLQPFVENAIKHGLLHKKGGRNLLIEFRSQNGVLCVIEDDGVGREKAARFNNRNQPHHVSFATEAAERRVELINRINQKKITFKIIDKPDAGGTRVEILIPEPS